MCIFIVFLMASILYSANELSTANFFLTIKVTIEVPECLPIFKPIEFNLNALFGDILTVSLTMNFIRIL
jgi:hypothetical protein